MARRSDVETGTCLERLTAAVRAQHPDTPTRFAPDPRGSAAVAAVLRWGMPWGLDPTPTLDEWATLARGLQTADPLADDVARDLAAGALRRHDLERAITAGAIPKRGGPASLSAFCEAVRDRPTWVDEVAVREGARVCALGGGDGMTALLVNALAGGYRFSAINQALIATGQLTESAAKRLGYTTRWFIDVTDPDDLGPTTPGFQSTLRVRLVHAMVRRRLLDEAWDTAVNGQPVNQVDMQATYLGFSVVYLLGLRMMGVVTTPAERAAYMHRWRLLAWLNGVSDDFLHPLDDEETSALVRLYHNVLQQPLSDGSSKQLARPLLLQEPFERRYALPRWLTGRYVRARQLSVARLSLRRAGMQDLGLPDSATIWYPVAKFALNQSLHRLARTVPTGRGWLEARGRRQQRRALARVGTAGPRLQHGSG
ncbi:MAG: DUF2236 domain-containing protein [Myxococcales bacterium]|nr:DUF2236 domain-containing protein [Myxococcales bacterium]